MGHYQRKSQAMPQQKQLPAPTHEEGAAMQQQLADGAKVARTGPKLVDLNGKELQRRCKKCKQELTTVCILNGKCMRCEEQIR